MGTLLTRKKFESPNPRVTYNADRTADLLGYYIFTTYHLLLKDIENEADGTRVVVPAEPYLVAKKVNKIIIINPGQSLLVTIYFTFVCLDFFSFLWTFSQCLVSILCRYRIYKYIEYRYTFTHCKHFLKILKSFSNFRPQ